MSNNLFLITGKVIISRCMDDQKEERLTNQLVWANDEEEARTTFYEFWESKREKYEVNYSPRILDITEALYS